MTLKAGSRWNPRQRTMVLGKLHRKRRKLVEHAEGGWWVTVEFLCPAAPERIGGSL